MVAMRIVGRSQIGQKGQPSSDFKLGYYFRGIDRHEQKLQAKLGKVKKAKVETNSSKKYTPEWLSQMSTSGRHRFSRLGRSRPRKKKQTQSRQQHLQCCGIPVHLVVAAVMGVGCIAVLGVFVALPLYLYLDRFPHMQCQL